MSSRLEEIKARVEIVAAKPEGHEPTPTELSVAVRLARRDAPVLVAAIEAVLALHTKERGWCSQCLATNELDDVLVVDWPCPTITAIRTALGEEQ